MNLTAEVDERRPEKRGPGRTNAIPAQMDKSLFEVIDRKLKSVNEEEQKRIREALERDKIRRTPKTTAYQTLVQLTYPNAADLADEAGVDMKDVIRNMGIELKWPNEDAIEMANLFDSITTESLTQIRQIVDALSPAFWKPISTECTTMLLTPTKRMLYAIRYRPGWRKSNLEFV